MLLELIKTFLVGLIGIGTIVGLCYLISTFVIFEYIAIILGLAILTLMIGAFIRFALLAGDDDGPDYTL